MPFYSIYHFQHLKTPVKIESVENEIPQKGHQQFEFAIALVSHDQVKSVNHENENEQREEKPIEHVDPVESVHEAAMDQEQNKRQNGQNKKHEHEDVEGLLVRT